MNQLLLQTFLLLLASYFIGAFLACLVKRAVAGMNTAEPARVPKEHEVNGVCGFRSAAWG